MGALREVGEVSDPSRRRRAPPCWSTSSSSGDRETSEERIDPLLDTTAGVQKQYPDLLVEQVGGASLDKALSETLGDDFKKAELISIPVTLVIMLLVFGALIAAGVPVLLAMSAVGAALGLSALASQLIPATDNTASMILLIGMAVGVDYSLFYVRRDREERAKGAGHVDAVEIAAATSGHAIVVSGIAVTVAMAGMFVVNDIVFSSIAVGHDPGRAGRDDRLDHRAARVAGEAGPVRRQAEDPVAVAAFHARTRSDSAVLARGPEAEPACAEDHPDHRRRSAGRARGAGVQHDPERAAETDLPRSIPIMRSYDRMTEAFPSTGASHEIAVRVPAGAAQGGGGRRPAGRSWPTTRLRDRPGAGGQPARRSAGST